MSRPIYVERLIRAPIDRVWQATQDPAMHQRWDLRFTDIEYLPRPSGTDPQRFRYATRIGFGVRIEGQGESVGARERDGERTSALRFWSDDAWSLIRTGSGYWRYVPVSNGVRFLTVYDYDTRLGVVGKMVDAIAFRPLLGWATAWSFDRLRLWLERGIDPDLALERTLVHWIARGALAFVWLYHGIVPKLLAAAGEIDIATRTGVPVAFAPTFVTVAAIAEILLAVALVAAKDARPFLILSGVLAVGLAAVTGVMDPALLTAPFQPVTIGVAMAALAMIGLFTARDLPHAGSCLRKVPTK
jgi:hypothetical protein